MASMELLDCVASRGPKRLLEACKASTAEAASFFHP